MSAGLMVWLVLASGAAAGVQPGATGRDVGYVVSFEQSESWTAINTNGSRKLKPGDGLRAGDRLVPGGSFDARQARLVAVLFTTGKARAFAKEGIVEGGTKPSGEWAALRAVKERLRRGTLEPALVRGEPHFRVRDAVLAAETPGQWRMLLPGIETGNYKVQVRRLGTDGAVQGTFGPPIDLKILAGDAAPPSITASVEPGFWQVVVTSARGVALGEMAWLFITRSPADAADFTRLVAMLDEARQSEGAAIDGARLPLIRAFMLELASRQERR